MPTRREVERAVEEAPEGGRAIVLRGDDLKEVAHRPPTDQSGSATLIILGPIELDRTCGGRPPAIRPGADGAETGELMWLSPEDARHIRRERNRRNHAASAARGESPPAATSAPVAADGGAVRPDSSAEAEDASTRPEVGVI